MVNKFETFMDEPKKSTSRKVDKEIKRQVDTSTNLQVDKKIKGRVDKKALNLSEAQVSIKLRKSSFDKLVVLRMSLGAKQLDLLDEAVELIFETKSAQDSRVKAFEVLMNDFDA